MATLLQQSLAEAIVNNQKLPEYKRKNKKELVVMGGYGQITANKHQTRTLEAKGVKEALASWGLTEGFITKALVNDIKTKPRKRLGELRLGAEILNMNEQTNTQINVGVQISGVDIKIRKD